MSDNQIREQTLILKGLVSELSDGDQNALKKCKAEIDEVIQKYGFIGGIAVTLTTGEFLYKEQLRQDTKKIIAHLSANGATDEGL